MSHSKRVTFTWEGSAARIDRMGEANRRAEEAWLRSLTIEESVRVFEDLSRGIPELVARSEPDPPPVVLFRLWRR